VSAAWSSSVQGSFSGPGALETSWTATNPAVTDFTLTLSEEEGTSSALSVRLFVRNTRDLAEVRFNASPRVQSAQLSAAVVGVGEPVSVAVSTLDLEGDTLSYSWVAECMGLWEDAASATTRFTPTAQLPVE
jgi:hypothetical protein